MFKEYSGKLPQNLSPDQQSAIIWKVESDFRAAHLSARACKDEYVSFAIKFYTRNRHNIEAVMEQHRAFRLGDLLRRNALNAVPVAQMAQAS